MIGIGTTLEYGKTKRDNDFDPIYHNVRKVTGGDELTGIWKEGQESYSFKAVFSLGLFWYFCHIF